MTARFFRPALLVIAIGVALPLFAEYKQSFREGVRAYDKGQWDLVVGSMRGALAEKAQTNERVNISGGRNEGYVPQFYLAAALANLGHCEDAIATFRDVVGVPGGDKFKKVVESKCGAVPTGPTPAQIAAEQERQRKQREEEDRKAKEATARKQREDDDQKAKEAIARKQREDDDQKAKEAIARKQREDDDQKAKEAIARKQREDDEQKAKDEIARKEREALAGKAREEQARIAAAAAARLEEAKGALGARVADGKNFLSQAAMGNAPTRAALTASITNATRALGKSSLPEMETATLSLSRSIDAFIKAPPANAGAAANGNAILRTAVQAYIRGQYNDALTLLSRAEFQTPVLRGQAALFRAAAMYSMTMMTGQKDEQTSLKIATDLAEYRRQQPGASPDARLFNPAFQKYVKDTAALQR